MVICDTNWCCRWISVLNNAKEQVLMEAFGNSSNSESSPYNQSVKELARTIIQQVRRLPGNQTCCDCGAPGNYFHFHLLGFPNLNFPAGCHCCAHGAIIRMETAWGNSTASWAEAGIVDFPQSPKNIWLRTCEEMKKWCKYQTSKVSKHSFYALNSLKHRTI